MIDVDISGRVRIVILRKEIKVDGCPGRRVEECLAGAATVEDGPFVTPAKIAGDFQSDDVDRESGGGVREGGVTYLNVLNVYV